MPEISNEPKYLDGSHITVTRKNHPQELLEYFLHPGAACAIGRFDNTATQKKRCLLIL